MKRLIPSLHFIISSRLKGKSFIYEFYFKSKKTLDLGCGEGEFMKHGKDHIVGIDPNARVIERLKNEGYQASVEDARKLSFKDEEFEAIHCHNVIEHMDVSTAYAMLAEGARVLKKDGLFVISSEVVTKKFWTTFGHVKPYPPEAIIKLLRPDSREEFDAIKGLEPVGVFYIGNYYKNKILYLISFSLGYLTPLFRREYFLVLRKK